MLTLPEILLIYKVLGLQLASSWVPFTCGSDHTSNLS